MAIPKNNSNNNNNQNNNNQYNNQNQYNNNQNNNNQGNYKKYNNMYIYVPSFCVNFESKFAISIKNILPNNLSFWISKSRIYDTKEYDNTINVLTLSIDMDKNLTLDTKQEIKPNQLIQAYQTFMTKLSDVFAHEEHINKFIKEHYDFHNKNVIEQQIIYNKMIMWKQAMEVYQEKQEYYASKQNNNQSNNNQGNNIEVIDINNFNNQAPQQNINNNNENQQNNVIDLDNLENL